MHCDLARFETLPPSDGSTGLNPVAGATSQLPSSLRAASWLNLKDIINKINHNGLKINLTGEAGLKKIIFITWKKK